MDFSQRKECGYPQSGCFQILFTDLGRALVIFQILSCTEYSHQVLPFLIAETAKKSSEDEI